VIAFNSAFLTVLLAVLAAAALLGAVLTRQALRRASASLERLDRQLVARSTTLPASLAGTREQLAGLLAATGSGTWSLARVDEQLSAAETRLRERREQLDGLRARIISARLNIARVESVIRVGLKAIEIRRTFLG